MHADESGRSKKRVLVLGASGFIGSSVVSELADDFDVYETTSKTDNMARHYLDASNVDAIVRLLIELRPTIVINCAGVVENSKKSSMNAVITNNLLRAIVDSGIGVERVVIMGSAAEYGEVTKETAITEESECTPLTEYGKSKLEETQTALQYSTQQNLPVTVLRVFNPIGKGMSERFLITRIMQQIKEVKAGDRTTIEVSRLDAARDYLDVKDVARAVKAIIEGSPKLPVYNVGSGTSTTNKQLLDLIVKRAALADLPGVIETSAQPEPRVASRADITKLSTEFGWKPSSSLEDVIEDIINAK